MNRAATKLREILEARDHGAYKEFAERIGAGQDMVSKWLADKHKPSLTYRVKISELLGIGILDWDDEQSSEKSGDAA